MGHRKPYIAQEMDYQSRYRETLGRQAEFGSSQPSGNTSAWEVRRRQERGVAALSFVVIKHVHNSLPLVFIGFANRVIRTFISCAERSKDGAVADRAGMAPRSRCTCRLRVSRGLVVVARCAE